MATIKTNLGSFNVNKSGDYYANNDIFEIIKIIRLLPENSKILRTNQTPISNRRDIILLILGGYYEFIFDFSAK